MNLMVWKELLKKEWHITRSLFLIAIIPVLVIKFFFFINPDIFNAEVHPLQNLFPFVCLFCFPVFLIYSLLIDMREMERLFLHSRSMVTLLGAKVVNALMLWFFVNLVYFFLAPLRYAMFSDVVPDQRDIGMYLLEDFSMQLMVFTFFVLLLVVVFHWVRKYIGKWSWILVLGLFYFGFPPIFFSDQVGELAYNYPFAFYFGSLGLSTILFLLSSWILNKKVQV